MTLPINLIPNTQPPRFRWKQVVSTPSGNHTVDHEGTLPAPVESAVMDLIRVARRQELEIEKLQNTIREMDTRITEMTRQQHEINVPVEPAAPPVSSSRKGKGTG